MAETFPCSVPDCEFEGKTKGSLTQHTNREHDDPLAALRNEMGAEMAPRPGGAWKTERPLRAQPSGVPSVDYIMGIGGIPRGGLVEVYGPPRAGKTFVALTFAAFAQSQGGMAGFTDAERALQPTFTALVPGLDVDKLEYGPAKNGEHALNTVRKFCATDLFDVWILDSLHACIPQSKLDKDIGDPAVRAALAQLLSEGLPVIEHVIADTKATVIMINHEKINPGQQFGNPAYTPGGSAPEYYAFMRMRVSMGDTYKLKGSDKLVMGHKVKVKLTKSKVSAPGATAEYDLYYREGIRADTGKYHKTGIDIGSCWYSVLKDENLIVKNSAGVVVDLESGEKLGSEAEVIEAFEDPTNDLVKKAAKIVYPTQYK